MMEQKENTVLKVENLSIGYARKKNPLILFEKLNFKLHKGSLVGLIGANGIGKSTLLRTLAAMQKPLNGSIILSGKELSKYPTLELAQQLSIVLTEPPASKHLRVDEFIALGRQPYTNWLGTLSEKDKDEVLNAMRITETESYKNKKCIELSDGQLQRVAIARAIAQDTPIIFMDEPTTHLDLHHRVTLLKLLQKLTRDANKTILFSTHEIDLAIQTCDQLIVLNDSGLTLGTPTELKENGVFQNLFPENGIQFDPKNDRFILGD